MPSNCEAWHPIPFFGPIETASAVTVAMNPSADEVRGRKWPDTLTTEALTGRLVGYFEHPVGPHPWFDASERPLRGLGLRYGHNLAHLDLVCRATRTIGRAESSDFLALADGEAGLFFGALNAATKLRLVVLSGSITNARYAHEHLARHATQAGWTFSPRPMRVPGGPFAARHELCRGDRRVAVLFTSASVNKRGGSEPYERLVLAHRDWLGVRLGPGSRNVPSTSSAQRGT